MNVHEKIKEIRSKKGLSTYQLSNLTGISQSAISKLENDKRKIDVETLQKIADALEVPIDEFFKDEDMDINEPLHNINKIAKENKIETLAAHFEGENFTQDDLEDIEEFIKFVVARKKK